jgi:tetratricopeptide (TPR) repeat protein
MFENVIALVKRNKWRSVFCAVLLAAALAMSPVLKADFVNWDDDAYVLDNPRIVHLDTRGIQNIFTTFHRGLYKPVTIFSFALDYRLDKLDPAVYHAHNYLLHLVNCVIVLLIMMELGVGPWAALFVGLVFGVHPLQVESVAWISERKELLHAFFGLWAIYLYLRWVNTGKTGFYIAAPFLFAIGLMAKPQGVALPFALILIDWVRARTLERKAVLDKIPFFALAVFFGALALFTTSKAHVVINRMDFSMLDNICVAAYAFTAYIWRFFVPAGLCAVYVYPVKTGGLLPSAYLLAPVYCLLLCAGLAYVARKNHKALAGLIFFALAILPTLQLVPVTPSVAADHYVYLPYIGLACALAALAEDLLRRKPGWEKPLLLVASVFIIFLGIAAAARAAIWHNSIVLWTDVINKHPAYATAYGNRSVAYVRAHNIPAMMKDVETGLRIEPDNGPLLSNRCGTNLAMGRLDEALRDCNLVIKLSPHLYSGWQNRSLIRAAHNDLDGAISDMKMAISRHTLNADAYARLANLYERKGDLQDAIYYYGIALDMNPDFIAARQGMVSVLSKLGNTDKLREFMTNGTKVAPSSAQAFSYSGQACLGIGEYKCAEGELSRALQLGIKSPALLVMRATAYGALHQFDKAMADFKAALAADPNNIDAYYNRGFMLLALHNYKDALSDLNTLLELKPDSAPGYLTRGGLYLNTGHPKEAADDFTKALALDKLSTSALNNRAMAYAAMGRKEEAFADIAAAIALAPDEPKPYLNRAEINMHSGNYAAAVTDAEYAIAFAPGAEGFAIRATALAAMGDCAGADRDFKRAQQLDTQLASAKPPKCVAQKK